jgi:hypothetical protein
MLYISQALLLKSNTFFQVQKAVPCEYASPAEVDLYSPALVQTM